MTEVERRADEARFRFAFREGLLDEPTGGLSGLLHDEGRGSFRFSDGRIAPSRTHANRPARDEADFFRRWVVCKRRANLLGTIPG